MVSVSCFYAIARPYKLSTMTKADILVLFLLETFSLATTSALFFTNFSAIFISALLLMVPHMVLIFYICYMLAKKVGITQCLQVKYEAFTTCVLTKRHAGEAETDMEAKLGTESLPDRLVNPGEYEPVQSTTKQHTTADSKENEHAVNEDRRRLTPVYTYGTIN